MLASQMTARGKLMVLTLCMETLLEVIVSLRKRSVGVCGSSKKEAN